MLAGYRIDKNWLIYCGALLGAIWLAGWVVRHSDIGIAIVVASILFGLSLLAVATNKDQQKFLVRLFAIAVSLRCLLALIIYLNPRLSYLGGDAFTYDAFGNEISRSWQGLRDPNDPWVKQITNINKSGWGMLYYVASVYYLIGQNRLAVQFINAVLGAITVVIVYHIVLLIIPQVRLAKTAALLTAFSPSMVLWSSQALKDAPIVLCLACSAYFSLRLREKFSLGKLSGLLVSLGILYSLRHYTFYLMFFAISGGLLLGTRKLTPARMFQSAFLIIALSIVFLSFGADTVVEKNLDLQRIQSGRVWSAKTANTGFGGDVDITDTKAALTYLPIGVAYVLLAPFPWMIGLKQLVIVPELILWWLAIPFLLRGFWYALRYKLKETLMLCMFTIGLTFVYALYQTNVGTAYRHRAQMYIFFFIFISMGWELRRSNQLMKKAERARWNPHSRHQLSVQPTVSNIHPIHPANG